MQMLPAFLLLLFLSFGLMALVLRPNSEQKNVRERLNQVSRKEAAVGGADSFVRSPNGDERSLAQRLSEHFSGYPFAVHLEELILYAGTADTVGSVILTSGVLAIGFGMAAKIFLGQLPMIAGAVLLGASAKYLLLRKKKAKRLKKYSEALPDAIELMARALRAGHSLPSSIEVISEQSPEPLASEFGRCFQQQKFGIPFRDSLIEMGMRMPSKDLHFLITAILVQKETGGDLTQILDRATSVIRERVRIEGEIKTYTAQGRLTGWILSGMPVAMLILINFITPGYSSVLFHDPIGHMMLYGGAGLILTGGFIIGRIVDIKV